MTFNLRTATRVEAGKGFAIGTSLELKNGGTKTAIKEFVSKEIVLKRMPLYEGVLTLAEINQMTILYIAP